MRSHSVLLLIYGVVTCLSLVETGATQTDPLHDTWRWVPYDTEAGLPANHIRQLVETTDGILWARAERGIAWYDGYRWWAIGRDHGLIGRVGSIRPDKNGGLLVRIREQYYQGNQDGFRPLDIVDGADTLAIDMLVPFDQQRLLFLSADQLYLYKDGAVEPFPLPEKIDNLDSYRNLTQTKHGHIWLTIQSHSYEWTEDGWQFRFPHQFSYIYQSETEGFFREEWHPSYMGTWHWKSGTLPKRIETKDRTVTAIDVGPQGDVVVAYASGEIRVRRNGSWQQLTPVPRQMEHPHLVYFQQNGNLWVANAEGLSLHRSVSQRWRKAEWQPQGMVHEFLQTSKGDLWVATASGITIRRATGRVQHITQINGMPIDVITGLAEDREGGIWVSSGARFGGAFRFFQNTWTRVGPEEGLAAPRVHQITPDRQGNLWFLGHAAVTGGGAGDPEPGAFLYDGERFTRWGVEEGLPNGRVYAFVEGLDGARWFGTLGGLSRWKAGVWKHWTLSDQGIPISRVFTLAVSPTGRVWFGLRRPSPAVGYIDDQDQLNFLDAEEGVQDIAQVWGLRFSPDSTLWITTDNGLWRYRNGVASAFGLKMGLPTMRLWSSLPLEDRVLIGTRGAGVTTLNLAEESHPPPAITVAEPLVSDQDVHFRWKVFGYQGELLPSTIETRYRVDEEPWSRWSTGREANLLNASPGSHSFTVQAKSLFGSFDATGATKMFSITPPLYRHPVFLGFVGLWVVSIVGMVAWYWRRQRQHLVEVASKNEELKAKNEELETRNAEMERFTYTVSHDLKTPLVTIRGFVDLLKQDVESGDAKSIERDMSYITRATSKMHQLLEELLELSRIGRIVNPPETISLTEVAQEAADLVAGSIEERGVEVAIAPNQPFIQADRVRVLEVYQNLLDNATKFMGDQTSPRIEVGAERNGVQVRCYVRDNGMGIESRYHEKIFGLFERLKVDIDGTGIGLALVKRIVEVHGGRIWVESEGKGHGSVFYFTFPDKPV